MAETTAAPEVGDWVRFMLGNRLQIGKVEYIERRSSWEHYDKAVTDIGTISFNLIREVRKSPTPSPVEEGQQE